MRFAAAGPRRSTTPRKPPSMKTRTEPRSDPVEVTQATARPVNLKRTLASVLCSSGSSHPKRWGSPGCARRRPGSAPRTTSPRRGSGGPRRSSTTCRRCRPDQWDGPGSGRCGRRRVPARCGPQSSTRRSSSCPRPSPGDVVALDPAAHPSLPNQLTSVDPLPSVEGTLPDTRGVACDDRTLDVRMEYDVGHAERGHERRALAANAGAAPAPRSDDVGVDEEPDGVAQGEAEVVGIVRAVERVRHLDPRRSPHPDDHPPRPRRSSRGRVARPRERVEAERCGPARRTRRAARGFRQPMTARARSPSRCRPQWGRRCCRCRTRRPGCTCSRGRHRARRRCRGCARRS